MNFSLDDRISKRLGVDNLLCPFHKSISFWGFAALSVLALFACTQQARRFFALGDYGIWIALMLVVVSALAFYIVGRTKIAALSGLKVSPQEEEEFMGRLRAISHALRVLTGLVMMSVLFAALVLK